MTSAPQSDPHVSATALPDVPGEPDGAGSGDGLSSSALAAQYARVLSADSTSDEGLDPGLDWMIRDEPGYRIQFIVEAIVEQDALEMVLQTADHITWWKSLSYFPAVQNGRGVGPEIRIETRNRDHTARQLLFLPDLTRYGTFELWKGGFLGWGAFAGSLTINSFANRGKRLRFIWHQD